MEIILQGVGAMKKLFLYVLLFVGIFSLCFLLANEYFKQRMQEKEDRSWNSQRIPFPLTQNGKTMDFW